MNESLTLVDRLGDAGTWQQLSAPLQTALFLGALALLPAMLVCLTPFTRILIVLSFVRRAVTAQDTPPNTVLLGLALFLTLFVMGPTLEEINTQAITPYLDKQLSGPDALREAGGVLKRYLLRYTRRQDLALFVQLSGNRTLQQPSDTPVYVLVPAYVISELKTAFVMGFCIYVPFLLVDLVVASILTAMGMMMMPPVIISAPFKVLLFVLADGWHLVARSLSLSFG
jgi:flagellar biosynthetic protein FliP